jgi:TonB family protein
VATRAASGGARFAGPATLSLLLHALLVGALLWARPDARPPAATVYRVDLVAAPAGPRQAGVVAPQPAPSTPVPEPERPAPATPPRPTPVRPNEMPAPPAPARRTRPSPPATTPSTAAPSRSVPADAPRAGGGPVGGRGTDVANVRTEGIEFPYPGYLENIVRQIALRFRPPQCAVCRAEVRFLIQRDGAVTDLEVVARSGLYAFDLEAQAAVEAAANARAFGALPAGFPDDVLAIRFSFDPRVIR